jgi:hypothetical protein
VLNGPAAVVPQLAEVHVAKAPLVFQNRSGEAESNPRGLDTFEDPRTDKKGDVIKQADIEDIAQRSDVARFRYDPISGPVEREGRNTRSAT